MHDDIRKTLVTINIIPKIATISSVGNTATSLRIGRNFFEELYKFWSVGKM